MAALTIPPANSQCCSSKNPVFSPTKGLMAKSARFETAVPEKGMKVTCQAAASIGADGVSVMERRKLMSLLLFGAIGLPAAGMLAPYTTRPSSATWEGGINARDEIGNNIIASEWLNTHAPGDKTLTQGLKGDPTYLIVEKNKSIATYGINAVCTHLGCIVPWNTVEKKFMCPCHGSQYDNYGKLIKGPAPMSLELARVEIDDDKVVFVRWTETDFRTGDDDDDAPWWS
ncbi:cytochrome b6-f complex iron-sulfur subunit, chloroplastic [Lactuca sativa]|uniref:plastoquinol--plastocyanin reductase n=1 Tax=Lactuca sativa TaxID=4236 RepID=A0A9R1V3C4_LACSA|nr:cytochrome b6-f complex iron-sulfur subunit, chloroplastic [Lactuca sativa]KAJ0198553.1 hypothetical protein LSAT_V11C700384210 [Lactuca sativa]